VLASNVVQSLQTVISRRKSALSPVVLTIGGIRSNTFRPNIIAEEVELTGTLRYFDSYLSEVLPGEVQKACSLADALGGSHEVRYNRDNPALVNDPQLTNMIRYVGKQILGQGNVVECSREMGAEDFSFYSEVLPSCFFFLGAAIEGSPRK